MKVLNAEAIDRIGALCREFSVARLELFGSACTNTFDTERSDVDFLVAFEAGADLGPWMTRLFQFQDALREITGRDVDVVMMSALRNPYFCREANKTRTIIFDASQVPQMA